MAARLTEAPSELGWRAWAILMPWPPYEGPDRAVGVGGFSGPPDEVGAVEIAYALVPSFREQGLATEAVEALSRWAFEDPAVQAIRAKTPAHLNASRRVLEKTGFAHVGEADDGLLIYERRRAA